jgi:hypothetical protein
MLDELVSQASLALGTISKPVSVQIKLYSVSRGGKFGLLAFVPYFDWSLEAPTTANREKDKKVLCFADMEL